MSKKIKDLSELSFLKKDIRKNEMNKEEYQEYWRENKSKFRKMISKKNKAWLIENSESEFNFIEETNDGLYLKISKMFDEPKKRKYLVHIISNFLPLNESKQVVRLPEGKDLCDLSQLPITDLDSIKSGVNDSRNKHIAFTGKQTDVLICGIALNEIVRFVNNHVDDYDSKFGQIINHALDKVRNKPRK